MTNDEYIMDEFDESYTIDNKGNIKARLTASIRIKRGGGKIFIDIDTHDCLPEYIDEYIEDVVKDVGWKDGQKIEITIGLRSIK